jgi:hypothetical protein
MEDRKIRFVVMLRHLNNLSWKHAMLHQQRHHWLDHHPLLEVLHVL